MVLWDHSIVVYVNIKKFSTSAIPLSPFLLLFLFRLVGGLRLNDFHLYYN